MSDELYKKLTQLQWLLHKRQMRGCAEGGPMADTTRGQGRILAALKMRDGISTRDLSYLLGIQIPSLNELLSKLVKGGYVTREPSEQDRRIMLVKLTDKGRNEEQPETADLDDIFACLSDAERKAFGETMDRILAALKEKNECDSDEAFQRMKAAQAHFADRVGDCCGGHHLHRKLHQFAAWHDFMAHEMGCHRADEKKEPPTSRA